MRTAAENLAQSNSTSVFAGEKRLPEVLHWGAAVGRGWRANRVLVHELLLLLNLALHVQGFGRRERLLELNLIRAGNLVRMKELPICAGTL